MRPVIGIVHPATPRSRSGNRVTALRWARRLRALGWKVFVERSWSGRPAEALVVLHAEKGADSARRYLRERGADGKLILGGVGTDLYGGPVSPLALETLGDADAIVVLQELARDRLPPELRPRTTVVPQTIDRLPPPEAPPDGVLRVALIAHARRVKGTLMAARAARRLPEGSAIRISLMGRAIDEGLGEELRREDRENARFEWFGELERRRVLSILSGSWLALISSTAEGGSNALTEALACGVGVVATDIDGNTGLLGSDHPALFPVDDDRALASLLSRLEREPEAVEELRERSQSLGSITRPEVELEAWRTLLDGLFASRSPS